MFHYRRRKTISQRGGIPHSLSLYVHIPFCHTLCTYCAFNTVARQDALIPPYLDALQTEIAQAAAGAGGAPAHTLYFGGGTPSRLAPAQVRAVIAASSEAFALPASAEITLEANPGDLTAERLAGYREAGVNRLSIGVQSAHQSELRLFGRRHTFEEAEAAFTRARSAGFDDISLDLIYGAPQQTLDGWRATLDAVLAWQPEHISLYALTLEPGTSLEKRVARGMLPVPDADLAADMFELAQQRLPAAGLEQYEIASWARPGHQSQHNRQYWLNRPFLGFGAGAHGAAAGVRCWNVDPIETYIARMSDAAAGVAQWPLSAAAGGYETIGPALEMAETVILNLRLLQEGVQREAFARRFGQPLDAVFGPTIARLVARGLLTDDGEAVRLTPAAVLVSNRVFVEFLPDDDQ